MQLRYIAVLLESFHCVTTATVLNAKTESGVADLCHYPSSLSLSLSPSDFLFSAQTHYSLRLTCHNSFVQVRKLRVIVLTNRLIAHTASFVNERTLYYSVNTLDHLSRNIHKCT